MTKLHSLTNRVLLCILDGFGKNPADLKNAILHAKKPTLDSLFQDYPNTTIQPGGEAVGLPKGVAGNSEVGHLNLGAGRPVRQDLVRINEAIEKNTFKDMHEWSELLKVARATGRLHLLGLLSDGGVHAHISHLKHILSLVKNETFKVYLHAFMDGRDTGKDKGRGYLTDILKMGGFEFASMQGRSIGMDRDRRWEKIQIAMDMMTGKSGVETSTPSEYLEAQYKHDLFDEFITPALFSSEGAIKSGDPVFFFNYRPDRARQITLAFNDPSFNEFKNEIKPGFWLCMSPYVQDELPKLPILFDKEKIPGTLCEYLSKKGLKQFKIAETEKYAHVTYFFNGGETQPFKGEEWLLIPSPREVATYDQKPEMSAPLVNESLMKKLEDKSISFFAVNFANCDMVGHTGNYSAAVLAVEAIDKCMNALVKKCADENIMMLLTADHGNADQMVYPDGSMHTSHSDSEVPFIAIHPKLKNQKLELNPKLKTAALKDVAPTVLSVLAIEKPNDFTGEAIFL
ncbi:MAG: 2,3-bisphosphoglycerate-independent phosphoglycerate mutase [Bacteriovoracaceae bacterium]|nr:2,3-bisphosphoglycerate-independent phosphoglycerate mutase [Bacteriovoracaceae bacterium]